MSLEKCNTKTQRYEDTKKLRLTGIKLGLLVNFGPSYVNDVTDCPPYRLLRALESLCLIPFKFGKTCF